jgi:hypothetical protein
MDDKDVERVAILCPGGWDEPPIVRIGQACHKRLRQGKDPEFRIVFEFALISARGFDDCVDVRFVGPSGKLCYIGPLVTTDWRATPLLDLIVQVLNGHGDTRRGGFGNSPRLRTR